MKIPVIINNRNLLTWVRAMVGRIKKYDGVGDIIIVDNASTYEPLLEWYDTSPCDIVFKENLGHYGAWNSGVAASLDCRYYVVTDPDMGLEGTPDDTLLYLRSRLESNIKLGKVGLGLEWEDVPESSVYYRHLQTYEKPRWENSPVTSDGVYTGVQVDTTFAMYPFGAGYFIGGGSTPKPYTAKHFPWFYTVAEREADAEFMYYLKHASASCSYKRFL